ncbi:MAG TPA: hypothetical protein VMA77_33850 [Solirubrobacteraceae bacterium]|nr:hypothetical protein [Solirubrobacteraceae bacterium]
MPFKPSASGETKACGTRIAPASTSLDRCLDVDRAESTLRQFDRTHAAYLQQLYDVDIGDCDLFHLVLDSTAIELDACAGMIVRAARSLTDRAAASRNGPP